MEDNILTELDLALDELRAARSRLTEMAPASPTGEVDVRVNVTAWEQAQRALINAQEKVEIARREIKRLLAE